MPQPTDSSERSDPVVWLASPLGKRYFDPAQLSVRDAQRHASLSHETRREEFAVSRSLQQYLAIPADTPQSLSHSAGHAAVVLAPTASAVGIDIEHHRPRDFHALGRFAFSHDEAAALEALEGKALERAFYARWVMKEAAAKALQLPLLDAARLCTFEQGASGWSAHVPSSLPWSITAYAPAAGLSIAVMLIGNAAGAELRTWEWPPMRRVDWPVIAKIFSAAMRTQSSPSFEESSTCRELLPTP